MSDTIGVEKGENTATATATASVDDMWLRIRMLQQEYDATLTSYQEAVQNYLVMLQNPDQNRVFQSLPGRTWWGRERLEEGPADSEQACEDMCLQSSKCSGATFNAVKRYCWTRSGDASVTVGTESDVALLSSEKMALLHMQRLNRQLVDINDRICALLEHAHPEMLEQQKEQRRVQKEMMHARNQLKAKEREMARQLEAYNTARQDVTDQDLYATQQQLWLYGLLMCVLAAVYWAAASRA